MIPVKKALADVRPYPVPERSRRGLVRLDMNENNYGCPRAVLRALRRIRAEDISLYPDYRPFIGRLAAKIGFRPEEIVLTAGADEAIRAVVETVLEAGDEVVFPVPGFPIYPLAVRLRQGNLVTVPYRADFSFPISEVLAAITPRTRVIVVVSPNNPTGSVISETDLERLLRALPEGVVLLDHTYHRFAGIDFSRQIRCHDNLVTLHSFSKIQGLAGLRLGYILAQADAIVAVSRVLPPFSVNSLALIAAEAALEADGEVAAAVTTIVAERERLRAELEKLGVPAGASRANFLLADFGAGCDKVQEMLASKKIAVKNLDREPGLAGKLRITIGRPRENDILLEELARILPFQGLLFDMDGVLVDVSRSYREAIRLTAQSFLNTPVTVAEVERIKARPGTNNDWEATAALLRENGFEVPLTEVIARFQSFYWGRDGDGLIRREEWLLSPQTLRELAGSYRLGVVTGRPRKEAEHVLDRFGVVTLFPVLVAMEDCGNRPKPDPLGIEMALNALGIRRAVYFGDHVDDMAAARAAGVVPIGICLSRSGRRERVRELRSGGARNVIRTWERIQEVINEICAS